MCSTIHGHIWKAKCWRDTEATIREKPSSPEQRVHMEAIRSYIYPPGVNEQSLSVKALGPPLPYADCVSTPPLHVARHTISC